MKSKRLHNYLFICLLLCVPALVSHAQTVDQAVDKVKNLAKAPGQLLKKGITASGSIAANSNVFQSSLFLPGQRPFEGNFNGSMLIDFAGKVKMPFTFAWNTRSISYTHPFDRKFKLQQPFNRFQLKPTYKSFSLLLGVNTLSFSEYTLNSYRFEGAGFTFKPAKLPFYVSFLNGVLRRAVSADSIEFTPNGIPSYRRTGLGFQVGAKLGSNKIEVSFLQGQDRVNSLPINLDAFEIYPKKNITGGIKTELTVANDFSFKADVALSAMMEDARTPNLSNENATSSGWGFDNPSTAYYKAIKTGLQYNGQAFTTGVEYSYIDPQYSSMGIYYIADDLQSIAGNVATQLAEGKLSLMASLGKQGQTKKTLQSQVMDQWVGSVNATFVPSEKFMATVNYSNFTSFTNLRSDLEYLVSVVPFNTLDTLNYRQVNQNLMGNATWVLGKDEKKPHTLNLTFMQQITNNQISDNVTDGSQIANANILYNHQNQDTGLQAGGGFNVSRNDFLIFRDWLYGPSATVGKGFFEQTLTTALTATYLSTRRSDKQNSGITNLNLTAAYNLKKKHQFSLNAHFLNRRVNELDEFDLDSWQFTASLSYRYSFQLFSIAKK